MNREVIGVGKTVEEALEKAYAELGADSENSEFEIMERPKRSLFGLKVTPARVRVTVQLPDPPQPVAPKPAAPRPAAPRPVQQVAPKAAERPEKTARAERPERPPVPAGTPATGEKVECAVAYLTAIFDAMELGTVDIKAFATPDGAVLTLSGEGLGVLIGRRGETLDALQYLSGLIANRLEGDYFRITIDSGNYREKRERTLEQLAKKLSSQVVKTGRSMTLEPMNPYERRIIHATVQNIEGVTSSSVGEEPGRRVVISSTAPRKPRVPPKEGGAKRPPQPPRAGNRGARPAAPRDGKPHEFRKNTNTAAGVAGVVTRPGAFSDSMRAAAPDKKRIDDSQFEIEPPSRAAAPQPKPEAPKAAPAVVAPERPLYSKIDID